MENINKSTLLWLFLDYYSYRFDENLPHIIDDKFDSIVNVEYVPLSIGYSSSLTSIIYKIAEKEKIGLTYFDRDKINRRNDSLDRRVEKYKYVKNNFPEKLDFIYNYIQKIKSIQTIFYFKNNNYINKRLGVIKHE